MAGEILPCTGERNFINFSVYLSEPPKRYDLGGPRIIARISLPRGAGALIVAQTDNEISNEAIGKRARPNLIGNKEPTTLSRKITPVVQRGLDIFLFATKISFTRV